MQFVQLYSQLFYMKMTKYFFAALVAFSISITACETKEETPETEVPMEQPANQEVAPATPTADTTAPAMPAADSTMEHADSAAH